MRALWAHFAFNCHLCRKEFIDGKAYALHSHMSGVHATKASLAMKTISKRLMVHSSPKGPAVS
jgi:hypothetical protein